MNIWVGGCFDILHTGHIDLLWYAKLYNTKGLMYGNAIKTNILYVGLDSDERVKMLKGDKRPINAVHDRVKMLVNLKMVDAVVVFHDDDELKYFINVFKIDYMIIGNQYKNKIIVGAECAKKGVIYYPTDDRSTTNIIEKIKKS
jgi:D-beta-D-heptose 7-phosphate kinase/D-beta-D-heptose 1-phosphate adenosyltransferase